MSSASQQASQLFANYTRITPVVPAWTWVALRVVTLIVTFLLAGALAFAPDYGLKIWWGFTIPIVPALIVIAPGLWRQICPMAFLNQIPRSFGFSKEKDLPELARDWAFAIAVAIFFTVVALRYPLLNQNGPLVALAIVGVLVAAFVGGLIYKGRSGWCGTFCPLGPIQRNYGQAPVVMVRNGYCPTCLGCQKSCYDFNPRAAIFSDINDDDPRYAAQRRFFMAMMPGMILGYFLYLNPTVGEPTHFFMMLAWTCGSVGLYQLLIGYAGMDPLRAANMFGGLALVAFYSFALPIIGKTLQFLFGFQSALPFDALGYGLGAALATIMLFQGRKNEEVFHAAEQAEDQIKVDQTGRTLRDRLASSGAALVTDRETGAAFPVDSNQTLLDALEAARIKINFGCRSGMCGADAVAICEGGDNLSAPGADELATLRRMGLEGVARLACMCKVTGEVTIDRDVRNAQRALAATTAPKVDSMVAQGISRVVVIGNGVAGIGVADALRRASQSVHIEIVTDEPHHFYNRMAIGRMIYGRAAMDGLFLLPDDWCQQNRVELWRNTIVAAIDREARTVHLATGDALPYDRLVLATGADAMPPTPDYFKFPNAYVLRKAADAAAIRTFAQTQRVRRAIVIGGGVLGVEAADALHHLGLRVTLLQRAHRLMDRQLDDAAAARLATYLANIGVETRVGVSVVSYNGDETLQSVTLSDGEQLEAELFVACAGLAPRIQLAKSAGIATGRGVTVDANMRTSDPNIYAVGDVVEIPGAPGGLWPVASAQAESAVADMVQQPKPYEVPRMIVSLKCDGVDVKSFGEIDEKPGDEVIVAPADEPTWWRLVLRDGALVGATLVGPPGSGGDFPQLVAKGGALGPALDALRAGRLEAVRDVPAAAE
jgi:nitrite reductase (NADH) large subunit